MFLSKFYYCTTDLGWFYIHFFRTIVITYKEGNHYDWHRDGSGKGYRKLSFISILNPPNEYDGGELEIEGIDLPEYAYDPLSIIVFNPALKHRVKPITRGIRHSLVTWFKEKAFPNELL